MFGLDANRWIAAVEADASDAPSGGIALGVTYDPVRRLLYVLAAESGSSPVVRLTAHDLAARTRTELWSAPYLGTHQSSVVTALVDGRLALARGTASGYVVWRVNPFASPAIFDDSYGGSGRMLDEPFVHQDALTAPVARTSGDVSFDRIDDSMFGPGGSPWSAF